MNVGCFGIQVIGRLMASCSVFTEVDSIHKEGNKVTALMMTKPRNKSNWLRLAFDITRFESMRIFLSVRNDRDDWDHKRLSSPSVTPVYKER